LPSQAVAPSRQEHVPCFSDETPSGAHMWVRDGQHFQP
jgi:hypothetical protein